NGNVFVVDSGNRRVEEFSETGAFIRQFGSAGTGEGQFTAPSGIAADSKGHVYVSDGLIVGGPDRIEEVSDRGAFFRPCGSKAFGEGQLNEPQGLAIDSKGNVWVADRWNQRIDEFSETGTFISKIGGPSGSGAGQLIEPQGVAVDSSGNVWVADTGNSRVQEFTEKGGFVSPVGPKGSGNGQLSEPGGGGLYRAGHCWGAGNSEGAARPFG